jgi:hypothetical protein
MKENLPLNFRKKMPLKVSVDNISHYDMKNDSRRKDYSTVEAKIRKHFYLGLSDIDYHKYYDDKYHQ